MRHRRKGRILKREKGQRGALIRSLMRSLILGRGIITTQARAKEVRPHLERLITKARSKTLANRRWVMEAVGRDAASRIERELLPRIGGRTSGFLRITRHSVRKSDASEMSYISFVD